MRTLARGVDAEVVVGAGCGASHPSEASTRASTVPVRQAVRIRINNSVHDEQQRPYRSRPLHQVAKPTTVRSGWRDLAAHGRLDAAVIWFGTKRSTFEM